jgi:LPS-assembly protein
MSFLDEPQDPLLRSTLAYQTDELIGLDAKIAFSQALSANLDVVSDANSGDLLSQFIELQWRGSGNDVFSVGYSSNDSFISREQIHVSGTYRLTSDWRMLFAANVDTRHNADLETLFGIEYESCCWRVRIIHSQYQDVPDGSYFLTKDDWREEQQTQIEVVLKGLGGFGQAIDSTLNQMIRGFHESIR